MGKHGATLPPAFSLLRSELGDFLYAPIDVEGNAAADGAVGGRARRQMVSAKCRRAAWQLL